MKKIFIIGAIVIVIAAFFAFDLGRYLTLDSLREHRQTLSSYVSAHYVPALLLYILAYIVVVAFSLPGALFMTLLGGFLFGTIFGTLGAVTGATIGAAIIFLAARFFLADLLKAKAASFLAKMEAGFRENAFNYLLVLRLIPVFPFFIVNLVPAFLGVSLRTFFIATFLGIIPGSLVYSNVGSALGGIFDSGAELNLKTVLTPQVWGAFLGLAALSMVPVIYKKLSAKKATSAS